MDWIKKHPAQVILIIVALGVLAGAALLILKVKSFPDEFVRTTPSPNNTLEKIDLSTITKVSEDLGKPAKWDPKAPAGSAPGTKPGSLFSSEKYLLSEGKLVNPLKSKTSLQKPISNQWLIDNKLDLTAATLKSDDPDKDGFTNLEEWNGLDTVSHLDDFGQPVVDASGKTLTDDATDPNNPLSHPPYLSKVVLLRVDKRPFLIKFMSTDGDRKNPESFQLNTNSVTHFLKLGDMIPQTRFRLEKFEFKERDDADGTKTEVSELHLINMESDLPVTLVFDTTTDSPDSFAIFGFRWVKPGGIATKDFPVRRNQEFALPPEPTVKYKLIDIKDSEVQILKTSTGEKVTLRQAK